MSLSRRAIARARQRVREDPRTVAEVVMGLMDDDDADVLMTGAQLVALLWWSETHGVSEV